MDQLHQVERIRNECLHQLQLAVLEADEAKDQKLAEIQKISPRAILQSMKPELRQKIDRVSQRLAAIQAIQEANRTIPLAAGGNAVAKPETPSQPTPTPISNRATAESPPLGDN